MTNLEALTSAIGQALNEVGGLRLTRLAVAANPGDGSLTVENSAALPASGSVSLDGVTYTYATNSQGTLGNIAIDIGNAVVPGAQMVHRAGTAVIDTSATASDLDLLKRGLFVQSAVGEDLNILGRNLGVNRFPDIQDDDVFRGIVQALAYNPQATVYGLTLALDAIVGAGQYALTEDLINHPCNVYVTVPSALFLSQSLQGNSFLSTPTTVLSTNGSIAYTYTGGATTPYVRGTALTLHPENYWVDCRTALPSAAQAARYPGDTTSVWTYNGSNPESSYVTVMTTGGGACQLNGGVSSYIRNIQATAISDVRVRALVLIPYSATGLTTYANNYGGQFGTQIIIPNANPSNSVTLVCGYWDLSNGTQYAVGLALYGAAPTAYATLQYGVYYEVETRAVGATSMVELRVNGRLIDRQPYANFNSVTAYAGSATWGNLASSGSRVVRAQVRYLGVSCQTAMDFWATQGTNATVSASAPNTVTLPTSVFTAGDVGKQIRLTGSAVTTLPTGKVSTLPYVSGATLAGNNNCRMTVQSVLSGTQATVATAALAGAQVTTSSRIVLPSNALTFPDDLGKQITLSGSATSNNGTYTIARLLEPTALVDYASRTTINTASTSTCEVTSAILSPIESNLTYQILPVFVNESTLNWELSDAGSMGALHSVPATGNMLIANVASGGDALGNLTGFQAINANTAFSGTASDTSFNVTAAQAWQGAASIQISPDGNDFSGIASAAINCQGSTTYTFSCYVKAISGLVFTVTARLIDSTGKMQDYGANINSSGWTRLTATLTTAAGATQVQCRVYESVQATYQYFTDGWQLEAGSSATAWALPSGTGLPTTQSTVSARQALPYATGVYDLNANIYRSSQVFDMSGIFNDPDANGNFAYWPMYVNDPLSAIENYVTLITAAGVSVNFTFT